MTRPIRWTLTILGVIVVLVVLFAIAIHTSPVQRYALGKIEDALQAQNISLKAGSLDYNLTKGSVTLKDVVIRSAKEPELPPIARIDRIYADLSLTDLLGDSYVVEQATIENPDIKIVMTEDGRSNIPSLPESEKKDTSPLDFFIQHARVTGGSLRYEDCAREMSVVLPGWSVSVDGKEATRAQSVALKMSKPGEVWYQQRTLPVQRLDLDATLNKDSLDIQHFTLGAADSTLTANGEVQDLSSPKLDMQTTAALDVARLASFAGVRKPVSGRVQIDSQLSGPISALVAEIQAKAERVGYGPLRGIAADAKAEYRAQDKKVQLQNLTVTSPHGGLTANGTVALEKSAGESQLRAQLQRLETLPLQRAFQPKGTAIASKVSGPVTARWRGLEFDQAVADADLRLEATRAQPAKDVLPVSGRLDATLRPQTIKAELHSLTTLGASTEGRVAVIRRNALQGELQTTVSNVQETAAKLNAFLGRREPLLPVQVGGRLDAMTELGGTLKAPRAEVTMNTPSLHVGELQQVGLRANVAYGPEALAIREARIAWRNESLHVEGTVGLKGKSPSLDLRATINNFGLHTAMLAAGKGDVAAQGIISAEANVGGTVGDPRGTVTMQGRGLSAYGEPIGALGLRAQIANQSVRVAELRVEKSPETAGGVFTASGTYQLSTKRYQVRAEANDWQIESLKIADNTTASAKVNFEASGTGTIDDPRLKATLQVEDIKAQQRDLGSLTANLAVANQTATVKAEAPRFNVKADAVVKLKEPYPGEFTVRANNTEVGALPLDLKEVKGNVTAEVKGSGPLAKPKAVTATLSIPKLDIRINGKPLRNASPVRVEYANQRLNVRSATLEASASRLSLSGTLPLEKQSGNADLRIDGRLDLASLAGYIPGEPGIKAQGTMALEGVVRGTLQRLDPTLTIALSDGYVLVPGNEPEVTEFGLQARLQNGILNIAQLAAQWAGASISAEGEVPLSILPGEPPLRMPAKSESAQFRLSVQGLELGEIAALPDRVQGRVSLRANVQAPRLAIDAVTGELRVTELNLDLGGVPMQQPTPSVVSVSNGAVRIQNLKVVGGAVELAASGSIGLKQPRPMNLTLQGDLNAGILASFTDNITAAGDTTIDVTAGGTLKNPDLRGFVQLRNGRFSYPDPRVDATNLNARVELNGSRVEFANLEGTLNGGKLSGGGGLSLSGGEPSDVAVRFNIDDFFMNYPEGLRTASDVELKLADQGDDLLLSGEVRVREGSFTENITIGGELLSFLQGGNQPVELSKERSPLLSSLNFDVDLVTESPIVVDNNLAELELTTDLKLVGTYYRPSLTGRARLLEGGQLRLNEREYDIERGMVTFTSETRIQPSLDVLARTQVNDYDITLQISGEANDLETTLTSDPTLPEPDIVALLITGRTLEQARGSEIQVAQEQLLSVLAGGLTGRLSSELQSATGLSLVRIEPNLIAAEGDPGARLTLGEDITPDLSLIYSMNLRDSSDQIYIAKYDLSRRFTINAVRQSDNSYRFEFRHVLDIGGGSEHHREKREPPKVAQLQVEGNTYFTDHKVIDKLGVKEGDDYDFFKVRRGMDKLRDLYADADLLESRLRLKRDEAGKRVDLSVAVEPGPKVSFEFRGFKLPGDLQEKVREVWMRGVFDAQRTSEASQAIRNWLVQHGYLQAKISNDISEGQAAKQVVFTIEPGVRYKDVEIVFKGAKEFSHDDLMEVIEDRDFKTELHTEPNKVTGFLEDYYRENGYLSAEVGDREYTFERERKKATLTVAIEEGPQYRFGKIEFNGNQHVDTAALQRAVPVKPGDKYRPTLREAAYTAIQDVYFQKGFNALEIEPLIQTRKDAGEIDLIYNLKENEQRVVAEIEVSGNEQTSEDLIRGQILLEPGDVLDMDKLGTSRSKLYNTGAYSLVDIERDELPAGSEPGLKEYQVPVRLNVKVQEIAPYQLRYGAFFDTERGLGGISDIATRNVLQSARVLGLRTRGDKDRQEARLYFSQPQLTRFPWKTDAQFFFTREDFRNVEARQPSLTDRLGFSFNQESRFWENYVVTYGYRIERVRTLATPDPALRSSLIVAPLTASMTRETRDNLLDSTHGSFQSHALEYGAGFLGSGQRYYRYFGQYFKYIPLSKPAQVPFGGITKQPRWIFAAAARVGLAGGLGGQSLVQAERFFAGGGTTVRGFEQDSLGPEDAEGQAIGGNALFVLNNELRFPIAWWFEGVSFVDIGNVYADISDFRPWDVRKTAGAGLRLRTPYFLLRLDAGFKLDRRPGESAGKIFLSIGQAF